MSNVSRLLAIDASVLRSAGDKAGHSAHSTRVLALILSMGHRAAICSEIQQEWNKHQSRVSLKWRSAMNARKKLVKIDISVHQQRIAKSVNDIHPLTEAKRNALAKDVHMLATAAHADRVILTGDIALKTLSDDHLSEKIEWLLAWIHDTEIQRQSLLGRLIELAKAKPFPALPQ